MLKLFLNNAGRKMSVVAKVQIVLSVISAVALVAAGIALAVLLETGWLVAPFVVGAVLALALGVLCGVLMQGAAVAADNSLVTQRGPFGLILDEAPSKNRALAKIIMVASLLLAVLLALGSVALLMATDLHWTVSVLVLAGAGFVLLAGWLSALCLQALCIAGGAEPRSDFFLRDAGARLQAVATIVLLAEVAICVAAMVTSVVEAVLTGSLWVALAGVVSAVFSLLPGWVYALTFQSLSDAAVGVSFVKIRRLECLLGKAGKKLGVVAAVYVVFVLVGVCLMLAAAAVLPIIAGALWPVSLILLAAVPVCILLSLMYVLLVKCVAVAAERVVIPQWRWQCICGTSNPLKAATCTACGEKQPVCPGCGKLMPLLGSEGCPSCRARVRWRCACGTANHVARNTCSACGSARGN